MEKIKLITLGPEGTFSHQASKKLEKYLKKQKKDFELKYNFESTISRIFNSLINKYDIAVVPLENSEAGSLGSTMDQLIKHNQDKVSILAEVDLRIEHYLTGTGELKDIKKVFAHPQAHSQCEDFLDTELSKAEIIHTASNSKSAEIIKEADKKHYAAIVPLIGSKLYRLPIIREKIQNSKNNSTRFIVLGKKDEIKDLFNTNIKSKTTIAIDPRDDRPGLLYELLGIFAEKLINLTKIESRPSRRKLGDYVFYIDIQGDLAHKYSKPLLEELEKIATINILGSYNKIN